MISENLQRQLELLPEYLGNHLLLTVVALSAGIVICIPAAVLITRYRRFQWPVLATAGIMQTIPGIALLALMVPLLGRIGFVPAIVALTMYSMLPILRNTVTGITGIERSIIEAANGIGMTANQRLFQVELPLALPTIVAGIRTSAVWVVGTATLSTPVGATSLGNFIFGGLQTQNYTAVLVGCISAAGLAILLDFLIRIVELAVVRRSGSLLMIAAGATVLTLGIGMAPVLKSLTVSDVRSISIGAKTFTEQYILSDLIAGRLQRAGYSARSISGLGSTVLFDALVNGSIDCYVDYSGTIWANHMKRDDVLPADSILIEMTEWLKDKHGIVCLGALGFENTYALALPENLAESLNVHSIADLAVYSPNLAIASDYEFFSRPEWTNLTESYGLRFREERIMDHTLMYPAVDGRQVDVISAYSTDGWIVDYNLRVLADPRRAFPPYDAIILLSANAAADSSLAAALGNLVGGIDNDAMRRANKIVDVDGGSVQKAATFLDSIIESGG